MRSDSRLTSSMRALEDWLLNQEVDRRRLVRRCAVAALLLVVSVYADVIFLRASVSVANLVNVTGEPTARPVQLFPERPGRRPHHGYSDAGGAAFQSEPSIQFVMRSIWGAQSIYWNPYSATGSLGPETLVDIKASPLSVAVALLGGSDIAFHLVFLGLNFLGVFCLLVLFAVELRLSMLAAIAGGITYLLNGFNVANLASNTSQTWFYFPVLVLALVSFAKRPTALSFGGITLGATLLLATTFLPTTLVLLASSLFVGMAAALGAACATTGRWALAVPAALRNVIGQLLAVGLTLLVLAVVYLPIIEALRYLGTGDYYAQRVFYPAYLFNLISLFTPKHAFESYNAISQRASTMIGNVAFHQGVIGALIASQVLRAWPPFLKVLLVAVGAAFLMLTARVYGAPGVTEIINALPVVGNIGQQYVWAGVSMFFTLLVPFGLQAILKGRPHKLALACITFVVATALIYASVLHRLDFTGVIYVTFSAFWLGAGTLLILTMQCNAASCVAGTILVLLSWIELTSYVNHSRLARTERFSEPPEFVRLLQSKGGLHRIASFGYLGIPPEYGAAYGIPEIGSMNFHILPRYEALFNRLILPNPSDRWATFATMVNAKDGGWLNLAAVDFLGAKYLVTSRDFQKLQAHAHSSGWRRIYEGAHVRIYENPNPLPRVFVVHQLVEAPRTPIDEGLSPRLVATSDDAQLIAAARAMGIDAGKAAGSFDDVAVVTRYDHARVRIQADLQVPGVLVLTDAWHPNWSVRVDGKSTHLGRVNEVFRGVPLAVGRHVVEMTYTPRALGYGMALSALGLVLLGTILLLRRRVDPFMLKRFAVATDQPRSAAKP